MLAIGLMSGTSIDGLDAALIDTDGQGEIQRLAFHSVPYAAEFSDRIRAVLGSKKRSAELKTIERELTFLHKEAVQELLENNGIGAESVTVIGFHGHTVHHEPAKGFTWQIGDGPLLAMECRINVVSDFRSADIAAGGEGAPLAPIFHSALMVSEAKPLAVLNLGGVGNVTWIGENNSLIAFDTGPGNALINDLVYRHTGKTMDQDGVFATRGKENFDIIARLLEAQYFQRVPPKSIDRNEFNISSVNSLTLEDGAATLTAFTVESVKASLRFFPTAPVNWFVCGGGRQNPAIMAGLARALEVPVKPIESVGWDGDAIEAQAFAYLAVRRFLNLPTSFPSTTGVGIPTSGGVLSLA